MESDQIREQEILNSFTRINRWRTFLLISSYSSFVVYAYAGLTAFHLRNTISNCLLGLETGDFQLLSRAAEALTSDANDYDFSSILVVIVQVLFFVAMLGWTHSNAKAAKNLDSTQLSFSTGWAIGAWFIPLFNFFRPREIIKESLNVVSKGYPKVLLNFWWGFFLLHILLSNFLARAQDKTISDMESLSPNSSLETIENHFYDLKVLVTGNLVCHWGVSIIPFVLLLILLRKTIPSVKNTAQPGA